TASSWPRTPGPRPIREERHRPPRGWRSAPGRELLREPSAARSGATRASGRGQERRAAGSAACCGRSSGAGGRRSSPGSRSRITSTSVCPIAATSSWVGSSDPMKGAGPLAHIRVVELTDLRGAFAGRLLADLGADVIKVEPPGGEPGRLRPPFVDDRHAPDRSLPFLFRNANKRGATIDLHDAEGWHRFLALCDEADVLIENLGPEGERRHGLAPAEVRERHPRLVHVALADFGLDRPRPGWRLEPPPALP